MSICSKYYSEDLLGNSYDSSRFFDSILSASSLKEKDRTFYQRTLNPDFKKIPVRFRIIRAWLNRFLPGIISLSFKTIPWLATTVTRGCPSLFSSKTFCSSAYDYINPALKVISSELSHVLCNSFSWQWSLSRREEMFLKFADAKLHREKDGEYERVLSLSNKDFFIELGVVFGLKSATVKDLEEVINLDLLRDSRAPIDQQSYTAIFNAFRPIYAGFSYHQNCYKKEIDALKIMKRNGKIEEVKKRLIERLMPHLWRSLYLRELIKDPGRIQLGDVIIDEENNSGIYLSLLSEISNNSKPVLFPFSISDDPEELEKQVKKILKEEKKLQS